MQWLHGVDFQEACRILAGDVDTADLSLPAPDPERIRIEREKRQRAATEAKRTALQRIAGRDLAYNEKLFSGKPDYEAAWHFIEAQYPGLYTDTLDDFNIGYSPKCPMSISDGDSITIPYYWGDRLINLRNRLITPNGQGKYLPEVKGLPNAIYNANVLLEAQPIVVLAEGEMKAMRLQQEGLTAVGIAGANAFDFAKWPKFFENVEKLYIALDPDVSTLGIAEKIAKSVSDYNVDTWAGVMNLPLKPDEFFEYGDITDFINFMNLAR